MLGSINYAMSLHLIGELPFILCFLDRISLCTSLRSCQIEVFVMLELAHAARTAYTFVHGSKLDEYNEV